MAVVGTFVLLFLVVLFGVLLGLAAVAGALLMAVAAGLIFTGVTSLSVMVGLARRSAGEGVRVWVLLLAGASGAGVGLGGAGLTAWSGHLPVDMWTWCAAGGVAGAGLGYFVGRLFNHAWGLGVARLHEWWRHRAARPELQTVRPAA